MEPIFLFVFIAVLLANLVRSGEAYIYFSRFITAVNSVKDKSPRYATVRGKIMEIEYKAGKSKYAVIVLKRDPLNWIEARALKGGQWLDRTAKLLYYAGPFRNFHGLGLTPLHISEKYEKIALLFADGAMVHIERNEVIIPTIKAFYSGKEIPTLSRKVQPPALLKPEATPL